MINQRVCNVILLSFLALLIVFNLTACGGGGGNGDGGDSGSAITETEETFNAHNELTGTLLRQFIADSGTLGEQAARDALISSLNSAPIVKTAALGEDGVTVKVEFTTGITVFLHAHNHNLPAKTTGLEPVDLPPSSKKSTKTVRKALLIAPYRYLDGTEYSQMKEALIAAGYDLLVQENTSFGQGQVDLTDYADWSSYDLVIVSSHGGNSLGGGTVIGTGVPVTDYKQAIEIQQDPYKALFEVAGDNKLTVALTPAFFEMVAAKMPNTVVIFNSCLNGTLEWAYSFKNAGAAAFIGFTTEVNWYASTSTVKNLINLLASCHNLGEAIEELNSQEGGSYATPLYGGPLSSLFWNMCDECSEDNVTGEWTGTLNATLTTIVTAGGTTYTNTSVPMPLSGNMTLQQSGVNISGDMNVLCGSISGTINGDIIQGAGKFLSNQLPVSPPIIAMDCTIYGIYNKEDDTIDLSSSGQAIAQSCSGTICADGTVKYDATGTVKRSDCH